MPLPKLVEVLSKRLQQQQASRSIKNEKNHKMVQGGGGGGGGDRFASQQILQTFQSSSASISELERVTDELVTLECNNGVQTVPLSSLVLPRDQSNLIRLLGSQHAYTSMLKLLRHFHKHEHDGDGTDSDYSGSGSTSDSGVYAYTAAIMALAKSTNRH